MYRGDIYSIAYNRAMRNQHMEIPEHLQERWAEATEELQQASQELNTANERYHAAVLARIAIVAELNGEV